MDLERVIGFASSATKTLLWLPDGSAFIYASYSSIILRYVDEAKIARFQESNCTTRNQHFLLGHANTISAMALSSDGVLLASSEERVSTAPCSIRIWDIPRHECLIVVKAHSKAVESLCFSSETTQHQRLLLCAVGLDDNYRTQILVWDCSNLCQNLTGKSPSLEAGTVSRSRVAVTLIARQTSDFPVQSIAFSPYEHEFPCLVSCGRENIRYWRVARGGHIVGHPVILKEYSRGTLLNALGFDALCESFPSNMRRLRPVYAASSVGTLLVIDYDSREVVCVYQLHDTSINCLVINEGFCVTGSDDGYLRVWPLDFSDYFLEAQHDAAVIAADVSADGMKVLVGGRNSAVGILDISSQLYKTVLRSHADPIVSSALLPWCASPIDQAVNAQKDEIITASLDGTLRVWNAQTGSQLYEFDVKHDQATWVEPSPLDHGVVAVGFSSGCCRIFDIHRLSNEDLPLSSDESTNIVVTEFQQHKSAICHLRYSSDGLLLYSSGAGKQLCMYTVSQQREFVPVKMLLVDFNPLDGKLSISNDNKYIAVISRDTRAVMLLQCDSLRVHCAINPPKPSNSAIAATELKLAEFSCDDHLLMLSKTDRLHIYSMKSQQFVRSLPLLGQEGGVTAIAMSLNSKYMATGGANGSLRVWQMNANGKVERMFQSFLGMVGSVRRLSFASGGKRLLATTNSTTSFVWRFLGDCSPHTPVRDYQLRKHGDDDKENEGFDLSNKCNAAVEVKGKSVDVGSSLTKHASSGSYNSEELSPSSDVPTPSAKPHLHLALANDALIFNSAATPTPSEVSDAYTMETQANNSNDAPTSVIQFIDENRVTLRLTQILEGINPLHVCWSAACGKLLYAIGPTFWVEDLGAISNNMDVRVPGSVCDTSDDIVLLQLSSCGKMVAMVDSSYTNVSVYCLEAVEPGNQSDGEHSNAVSISLQAHTDHIQSIAFAQHSLDLICFASKARNATLISVASLTSCQIVWSIEASRSVDTVIPLCGGIDRFLLFSKAPDASTGACAHMLTVVAGSDSDSSYRVLQTTLIDRFPLDVSCVALSMSTKANGMSDQRFVAAIANDSYCCFFDLETGTFIATTKLLPASTRSRNGKTSNVFSSIDVLKWSNTDSKQSLLVTGSYQDTFLHVHALPMQSTKFSSYSLIDWQRVGRSGVSLTHIIEVSGGQLCSLSVDPSRGVGVAAVANGTVSVIDFSTGSERVHRRGSKPQRGSNNFVHMGDIGIEDAVWAVNDALVLSRSQSSATITAWLPETGCEVVRFEAGSLKPSTTCNIFTVHATQSLVLASYGDGTLRLFDVSSGRNIAAFSLALDRRSFLSPEEHAEHSRSLRTLRHRASTGPGLKSSPLGTRTGSASSFSQLEFVGESGTVVAATSDGRAFLIDYSKLDTSATIAPPSARKLRASSPARIPEIVYHEIVVSTSKKNHQFQTPISATVVSIDVVSISGESNGSRPNSMFLIVIQATFEGYSKYEVKVFADFRMQVLSGEKIVPTDEWGVKTPECLVPVGIFLPASPSTVLYTTTCGGYEESNSHSASWCLEIRDFRERRVLRRLILDLNSPGLDMFWTPVQMSVLSKSESSTASSGTVLLADAHGRMLLLNPERSELFRVDTRIAQSLQLTLLSSKGISRAGGKLAMSSSQSSSDNNSRPSQRRVVLGEVIPCDLQHSQIRDAQRL